MQQETIEKIGEMVRAEHGGGYAVFVTWTENQQGQALEVGGHSFIRADSPFIAGALLQHLAESVGEFTAKASATKRGNEFRAGMSAKAVEAN